MSVSASMKFEGFLFFDPFGLPRFLGCSDASLTYWDSMSGTVENGSSVSVAFRFDAVMIGLPCRFGSLGLPLPRGQAGNTRGLKAGTASVLTTAGVGGRGGWEGCTSSLLETVPSLASRELTSTIRS